jgi:nucleotide-binding universal stress UspA family protein
MNLQPDAPLTVLVPLDGSERAEAVLGLATALARKSAGRLVLVTVPEVYGMDVAWYTEGSPDAAALVPMSDLLAQARSEREAYLSTVVDRLRADGINVTQVLAEADPADAIIKAAADHGAQLIAMTTHGRSGFDRWAFGSVTDKVLQTAGLPVLLERAGTGAPHELTHLLVALDGSEHAEEILPIAAAMAHAFGARLSLVHVTPEASVRGDLAKLSAAEADYQARMTGYLAEQVTPLTAAGLDAEGQLLAGDNTAAVLLERTEHHDVDLVALTTHGRSGLKRLAYGSVADRLIRHSPKPLLVVRNSEK